MSAVDEGRGPGAGETPVPSGARPTNVVDAIRHLVDVGVNAGLVAIEVERESEALVAAICADDPAVAASYASALVDLAPPP